MSELEQKRIFEELLLDTMFSSMHQELTAWEIKPTDRSIWRVDNFQDYSTGVEVALRSVEGGKRTRSFLVPTWKIMAELARRAAIYR